MRENRMHGSEGGESLERLFSTAIEAKDGLLSAWIPAQICLEQICINPKGIRQDSLM
jgi:hypothetical protein